MGGLGPDDKGPYTAPALSKNWVLRQKNIDVEDAIDKDASSLWGGLQNSTDTIDAKTDVKPTESKGVWARLLKMDGAEEEGDASTNGPKSRWVWEYKGPRDKAPKVTTMVEENLGPYQKKLLVLAECDEIMNCVMGGQ